jgi:hypothetical protein
MAMASQEGTNPKPWPRRPLADSIALSSRRRCRRRRLVGDLGQRRRRRGSNPRGVRAPPGAGGVEAEKRGCVSAGFAVTLGDLIGPRVSLIPHHVFFLPLRRVSLAAVENRPSFVPIRRNSWNRSLSIRCVRRGTPFVPVCGILRMCLAVGMRWNRCSAVIECYLCPLSISCRALVHAQLKFEYCAPFIFSQCSFFFIFAEYYNDCILFSLLISI